MSEYMYKTKNIEVFLKPNKKGSDFNAREPLKLGTTSDNFTRDYKPNTDIKLKSDKKIKLHNFNMAETFIKLASLQNEEVTLQFNKGKDEYYLKGIWDMVETVQSNPNQINWHVKQSKELILRLSL